MKRLSLPLTLMIFTLSLAFASCERSYNCTCRTNNGQPQYSSVTSSSKGKAQTECQKLSTITTQCQLE